MQIFVVARTKYITYEHELHDVVAVFHSMEEAKAYKIEYDEGDFVYHNIYEFTL